MYYYVVDILMRVILLLSNLVYLKFKITLVELSSKKYVANLRKNRQTCTITRCPFFIAMIMAIGFDELEKESHN